MSNETVTYSLEAVLTRIEGKIDNLQKDVNQKFESLQKDFGVAESRYECQLCIVSKS